MKVVTTGLYRSGTTWLYNATRLLMAQANLNPKGAFGLDYRGLPGNVVIKTHAFYDFMADEADYVIMTARDVNEIKESMRRMATLNLQPAYDNCARSEGFEEYKRWYMSWLDHVDTVIRFETIVNKPHRAIESIALTLGIQNCDIEIVNAQLMDLKAPRSGHDSVTFMSEAHDKFFG